MMIEPYGVKRQEKYIDRKMETRGIRNNNPLNIRKGSQWKGMAENQLDKDFVQFKNMIQGIRAGIITLRTYFNKHNINTIEGIIKRWAPASENNTKAYIEFVCKETQNERDDTIIWEKWNIFYIMKAMSKYESGYRIERIEFEAAWMLSL